MSNKIEMSISADEAFFVATCVCVLLYVGSEHARGDAFYENEEKLLKILRIIKKGAIDDEKELYKFVIPESLASDFRMALSYGISFYGLSERFKGVDKEFFLKYVK